ncbi:hypothetical protein Prudu_012420 [Prunus dulcis]|uniref:AUGMIN subunit 4 n=1 Tax=Prunus dulcis TaxID=3755 RepID=A0A4Y1RCN2_PRUDU|nr:hypothetical protein Prudu_012420 [Prunus dulcis]
MRGLQLPGQQNLPPDVTHLIDQLERHCLAPDASLVSKSAYFDLQLAREEMSNERLRYLEAMAIYSEAIAMVEEYEQGLNNSPQLYETLEHRMTIVEAAQRLRLPLLSKDGEIHEDEIEKCGMMSRSSLDSTCTSFTVSSSSNSTNCTTANSTSAANNNMSLSAADVVEPAIGGVPNCFLGITPGYLWQTQLQQTPFSMDMAEYQLCLSHEIEARLKVKCDVLADAFVMDDIDSSPGHQISSAPLPERIKLIIEETEREEAALQEDLYSADRKFSEYYNDEQQKIWLCKRCETMSAKLRKLKYSVLGQTYTRDSVPALYKIRKYLLDATKEADATYDKAITRLREYQDVDPHFDKIARQYHDIVKELENMQWTIHQVEMDLKHLPDQPNA